MKNSPINAARPTMPRWGFFAIGVFILLAILYILADTFFGYVAYRIGSTQVGVKFRASRPYEVVGPGVWTQVGLFEDIVAVKIEGLAFRVADPEVLTKDLQRIGIEVAGTVHRPGLDKANELIGNWANYSTFYLNDDALVGSDRAPSGLMVQVGKQAMKVCVGDLEFNDAVVGSARDKLRDCIDRELDKLAKGYGLEVRNVVVPDIILAKAVQEKLDQITDARFATQLANQNKLKADADATRELAIEQGKIRVEQGKIQEKALQDAKTAELNRAKLEAEKAVIEAEKRNALVSAEKELEISLVRKRVAEENAKAELATEIAKAEMYGRNQPYVDLLKTQATAGAYSKMDKVMIIPDNVNPYLFLGGQTMPITVPATPTR